MKNVFLDCGYHLGEGLTNFTNLLNINNDWEVHVFEPNPYCYIEKNITQHPFKIHPHKVAVWTEDTSLKFNIQHQNQLASPKKNSHHELDGWGSCITELNSSHTYNTQEEVIAINFSDFLKQFTNHKIFCKMDIEGAEFPVLRKLIHDDTIKLISEMWIEWHTVDFKDENRQTEQQLIKQLNLYTKTNRWY
jgi:FkbM family methyltransferase